MCEKDKDSCRHKIVFFEGLCFKNIVGKTSIRLLQNKGKKLKTAHKYPPFHAKAQREYLRLPQVSVRALG